jgi:hypothetical protein
MSPQKIRSLRLQLDLNTFDFADQFDPPIQFWQVEDLEAGRTKIDRHNAKRLKHLAVAHQLTKKALIKQAYVLHRASPANKLYVVLFKSEEGWRA